MESSTARRPRIRRPATIAAAGLAAVVLAACSASPARVALPDPGPGACGPEAATGGAPAGTLTVVADGPADPIRLPHARSLAERLLVRHLHRSLVRVDCRGRVLPGLAESWRREDGGRRWRFRLAGTVGPEGEPVTARSVLSAWEEARLSAGPVPPSLLDSLDARAEAPRILVVETPRPLASPAVFARPAFAVAGRPATGGWPGGTGIYRPARSGRSAGAGPDAGILTLRPAPGRRGPVLRIAPTGPERGRDLVDGGADLVLTRDPGLLAYAGALDEMVTRPLPWSRTYLLVVPPGPGSSRAPDASDPEPPEALQRSLARHAVRGAARPAPAAGWWSGARCGPEPDGAAADRGGPEDDPPPSREDALEAADEPGAPPGGKQALAWGGERMRGPLVHPAADRPAADLAGRLVALSGRSDGSALPWTPDAAPIRTSPRGEAAFRRALRSGRAAGYVLPVRHRVLDPCGALAALRARVPWLERPGARLVPLVTTRGGLAVRRDLGGLRIDWDGVPRLDGAVRRAGR